MKVSDFARLRKYMMMTMSGADSEVLSAMKHANALLVAEGVDWDRVLGRMVTLEVERAPPDRSPRTEDEAIEQAFADVEADDPRGSFATFIASLREQWDERGRLSDAQKRALFDAATRSRSR